jgi:hypothetical protein
MSLYLRKKEKKKTSKNDSPESVFLLLPIKRKGNKSSKKDLEQFHFISPLHRNGFSKYHCFSIISFKNNIKST